MKQPRKPAQIAQRIRKNPTILLVPFALIAITILVLVFRHEIWEIFSTPERIEKAVIAWGVWAPFAFIILQFVQVVIFIIPGEIPQIAGGYLFGLGPGTLYSILGSSPVARCLAAAIISGSRSMPTTLQPSRAKPLAMVPVPVPRSNTLSSG